MNLTDEEKRAIYADLLDLLHKPQREEFPTPNITVSELAEMEDITEDVAYARLENSVKAGLLEKKTGVRVERYPRGVNLYWKKQTPTE